MATATATSTGGATPTPTPGPEAGSVLLAGGDSGAKLGNIFELATSTVSTAGGEIFDSATDAFVTVGSLNTAREAAATVVLPNNLTLIVGGGDCASSTYGGLAGFTCVALQTAELYNEVTQTFTYAGTSFGANPNGKMTTARSGPSATLISGCDCPLDGDVLIVGGSTGSSYLGTTTPPGAPTETALNTAELYDPTTDTFTAVSTPIPGCPAGESIESMPACVGKLASVCNLPASWSPITSASESGTTVTVTSPSNPPGLTVGSSVTLEGVSVAGYNSVFIVTAIPTSTTFTFSTTTGLAPGTGGLALAGNILTATESGTTVTATTTANPPGLIVGDDVTVGAVSVTGYIGTFAVTAIPSSTTFQYTPVGAANPITTATESGTTVTITSVSNPVGLVVGNEVVISGVSVAGYNGTFTVASIPSVTTFTYTAASGLTTGSGGTAAAITEGLAAAAGGTAAANTFECGMVDQGAALIPNDGGQVLLAGGDLVTFLGESSNLSFLFNPATQTFTGTTGNLNTPREQFALVAMDPAVVKGPLSGYVVAFGGLESNSVVCTTSGDIVATSLNTAEVFDPSTQTWSVPASTMGVKRLGAATLIETGSLAGEVILPGGVDVEAGTLPTSCVAVTNLAQAATTETDLYNPGTGTGGTFSATGSLNQAREGQAQAVIGAGTDETDVLVVGGACTTTPPSLKSAPIGTAIAKTYCGDAAAQTDYSELYSQSSKTWTVGPSFEAGFTPTNSAAYGLLP